MSDAIVSKACTKCREVKSLTDFSPNKYQNPPYQSQCKSCCNEAKNADMEVAS